MKFICIKYLFLLRVKTFVEGAAIVYQPIHWIVQQTSTWVKCHKQGDIVFTQWNTTRDQWIPVHSDRRGYEYKL